MNVEIPDLTSELRRLLRQIPRGRVTTYGDLAHALGSKAAARWIGEYLANHRHPTRCRCYRVVRHNGDVGLFVSGNSADNVALLSSEGIELDDGRVDLKRFRFDQFTCERPLAALIEQQREIADCVALQPLIKPPEFVAGVDLSYIPPDTAVAAYVLVDTKSRQLQWSTVLRRKVKFPYIPGFLTYREFPLLLSLLESVERKDRLAAVIFVDGNGILHPRRAGIATQLGVATGCVTIGVAKSLLCGCVDLEGLPADEFRPIELDGEVLGFALKSQNQSRPFYVSPGHKIVAIDAADLAKQLCNEHRLPEPIYLADSISRQAAAEICGRR